MKRIASSLFALLLVAGCAWGDAPAPPAPVTAPTTASPDNATEDTLVPDDQPAPGATAAVEREAVAGGFRLGPFTQVKNIRWLDESRIYAAFLESPGETLGTVALAGGGVQPLAVNTREPFYVNEPVLSGTSVLYSDAYVIWLQTPGAKPTKVGQGWWPSVSPDGTRVVGYGRSGRGFFTDLRSGKGHALEVPATSGGPGSDVWSPDGRRYLVQGRPGEPVPGFYFFDEDGEPVESFAESGFLSFSAAWSPDAKHIAFLSLPLKPGEDAPSYDGVLIPIAPRVGLLDVATGMASYFTVPGKVFRSPLLWSPDGQKVAVTAGEQVAGEFSPEVRGGSVYVADLSAGTITPAFAPVPPERTINALAWSPDSRSLLYLTGANLEPNIYAVTTGGVLPGESIWLNGERLLAVALTEEAPRQNRLYLTDRNGEVLRTLASGSISGIGQLALSPDGRHLAFAWRSQQRGAGEYLMVLQLD